MNSTPAPADNPPDAPGSRRIIRTARTEETINEAARNGFRPLVLPVVPNPKIRTKVAVFQNPDTGEIEVVGDYRHSSKGEKVMDFTWYYYPRFPSPFAAYLLPSDLKRGEEVWLEDLIEDIVGGWWNQGDTTRLKAAPAIWSGRTFRILFDPEQDAEISIG